MKPTQELIWALRRAAVRILDPGEGYEWCDPDSCNCGLLVREILGMSRQELQDCRRASGEQFRTCWTVMSLHCNATGLPMTTVFETLREVGFERDDFERIELCLDGSGLNHTWDRRFKEPRYVSNYFNQLADKLEKDLPTGKCSSGTIQSRPYPARTVKVKESAAQHTNKEGVAGTRTDCEREGVATTSPMASGITFPPPATGTSVEAVEQREAGAAPQRAARTARLPGVGSISVAG